MNEFNSLPESISHKQLSSLLGSAIRDTYDIQQSLEISSKEKELFNELTKNWASLSKELLNTLNQKDSYLLKSKQPNSLMALGALEAHLNMAIQALKASESD